MLSSSGSSAVPSSAHLDQGIMRSPCFRILAAVLAISLISISSWVSVCELSCSLSHSYPLSYLAKVAFEAQPRDAQTSTPRSHCGHVTPIWPSATATHNFENTSGCTNAPCMQAAVLSSPVNGLDRVQIGSRQLALPAVLERADSVNTRFCSIKRGAARPKVSLLDPRSVGLRI